MEPLTMGLIAGGIGATAGLAGNFVQAASSKKLMRAQYNYNKKMMQNAHQWTVQDLQKAGLNPVLSATQGANAGSGVGLPSAPDYGSTLSGAVNSAVSATQESQRIQNETATSKTTQEVNSATADNQRAQANKNNIESGIYEQKTKQEIKESENRIAKNNAEIDEITSKIELNQAEKELKKEQLISELGTLKHALGSSRKNATNTLNPNSANVNKEERKKYQKRIKEIEEKLEEMGFEVPDLAQ